MSSWHPIPKDAEPLTPGLVRTLWAALEVYDREGRIEARTVAAFMLLASWSTTHTRLHRLVEMGWLRYEPGKTGTMHPAVTVVRRLPCTSS